MEDPGHGIVGREGELARVRSFIGSVSEGPSALLLEGAAGIGKTTLWLAGVSIARARGHRVLCSRAAESRALRRTSEPCRSRRWGSCARWPRPDR
jgi:predicted ATP-dependent serine protease